MYACISNDGYEAPSAIAAIFLVFSRRLSWVCRIIPTNELCIFHKQNFNISIAIPIAIATFGKQKCENERAEAAGWKKEHTSIRKTFGRM